MLRGEATTCFGAVTTGTGAGVATGAGDGVNVGVGVVFGAGVTGVGAELFGTVVAIVTWLDTETLLAATWCTLMETPTRPRETNNSVPRMAAGVSL